MTTIKTSSLKTYSRIHNYLYNKNIECWGDLENLAISFFNLTREETDELLKKLLKHFHLKPDAQQCPSQPTAQQEPSQPDAQQGPSQLAA